MKTRKILFGLITSMVLMACSSSQQGKDTITGAWMYLDVSDMYIEVLISDKYFITHNEVIGTTTSKIISLDKNIISISDIDDSPVNYQISRNAKGQVVLSNEWEEFELTSIDVDIDLELIAKSDSKELNKYWEGFQSRMDSIHNHL